MPNVIETHKLSKRFGQRIAVDSLDLQVAAGEIYGFLGPNGAGKTTTIAMLLALVKPTSGQAFVLGYDIQKNASEALQGVGAMVEAPAFYPYLSGWDNLRVFASAAGLPNSAIERALSMVDLSTRAKDKFRTYSQGMKQRLGIAAALLHDPKLIILDEPTNGLDPAGTVELRELIRSLAADGRTVFISSHLLHEVEHICSRVAILKSGKIVREGAVAELLKRDQGLLLDLASEHERAAQLLRQLAWVADVRVVGKQLEVEAPSERAAELNMFLAQQGIAVSGIRARESSLEELFLELTQTTS
jgi:ABC-type multidrug transport system, ATPase component